MWWKCRLGPLTKKVSRKLFAFAHTALASTPNHGARLITAHFLYTPTTALVLYKQVRRGVPCAVVRCGGQAPPCGRFPRRVAQCLYSSIEVYEQPLANVRFTPKSGHCIAPQRMSALCQKRTFCAAAAGAIR